MRSRQSIRKLFLWFFLAACPLTASAENPSPVLRTLDGESFEAQIIEANSDGLTVETLEGIRSIAWEGLLTWGELHESTRGPQIVLSTGDLLVANILSMDEEGVTVANDLFASWEISYEAIRGIVFAPPVDALRRDRLLDAVSSAPGGTDRVLLSSGDTIEGTLLGMVGENLKLEVGDRSREIPIDDIVALILDADLVVEPEQTGSIVVGFRDGSRLHADSIAWTKERLRIDLPGIGVVDASRLADPVREIVFLQNESEGVSYLSFREPTFYQQTPYLDITWPLGIDRTPRKSRLRVAGRLYQHGLSMHSRSRIEFDIDPSFQRFEAELAIDDTGQGQGSAIGSVLLRDASGEWNEVFRSEVSANQTGPTHIVIDLDGADGIALVVDYGRRADVGDVVDWLDARLLRVPDTDDE